MPSLKRKKSYAEGHEETTKNRKELQQRGFPKLTINNARGYAWNPASTRRGEAGRRATAKRQDAFFSLAESLKLGKLVGQ